MKNIPNFSEEIEKNTKSVPPNPRSPPAPPQKKKLRIVPQEKDSTPT